MAINAIKTEVVVFGNRIDVIRIMIENYHKVLELRFCSLEYIKTLSIELSKVLDVHNVQSFYCKQYAVIPATNISTVDGFGNSMLNNYGEPSFDTLLESK